MSSAAGMKHLRDNDVIHRDIKPGNIMRYITDDGRWSDDFVLSFSCCCIKGGRDIPGHYGYIRFSTLIDGQPE